MKKIYILSLLFLNLNATTYLATLDDKHYKENIAIKSIEEETTPSVPSNESPYNAGDFIETDWLVDGDKRALLDAKTGKEWLDLRETSGIGWDNIDQRLSTDLSGWRKPTRAEVYELMENFFNVPTSNYTSNNYQIPVGDSLENRVDLLFNYMGTSLTDSYGYYTYGSYDHEGSLKNAGVMNHFSSGYYYLRVNLSVSASQYTGVGDVYGIWLVSDGGTTRSSIMNPSINIPAN